MQAKQDAESSEQAKRLEKRYMDHLCFVSFIKPLFVAQDLSTLASAEVPRPVH